MTTTPTPPAIDAGSGLVAARMPAWPRDRREPAPVQGAYEPASAGEELGSSGASRRDALQALLAFSALHQQVRQRRALAAQGKGFEALELPQEFESGEQFVLDDVLQLVAERALAITGADGLGIALAENNEIVLRASAGRIKPDVGARIQRDSAFSGACFRTAQIIRCDDTETDERVNLYACRQLGARSMVAVPLCGRRRVIGLLEAFSTEPFGFNESDVVSLGLLAELILGALKPEDEDRFAESAKVAEAQLAAPAAEAAGTEIVAAASTPELPIAAPVLVAEAEAAKDTSPEIVVSSAVAAAPVEVLPEVEKETEIAAEEKVVVEEAALNPPLADLVEEDVAAEEAPVAKAAAGRHPGMVLALVLVVVTVLLAGGIWWKLKNAQLGEMVVRPEPKVTRSKVAPKAAVSPSSANSAITSSSVSSSVTTAGTAASSPSNAGANGQMTSANNVSANSAAAAGTQAELGAGGATLPEPSKLARVTGIRHWSSADSSTVVIDLEDQVQYEAHRLSGPDRIYFDLHDTSLVPELVGKTIEVGDTMLARIRVSQLVSNLTRVVLETKGNSNFSVSLESNPYRLVVQVRKLGANAAAEVDLFPGAAQTGAAQKKAAQEQMAIVIPPPTPEDLQLRARAPKMRIVVDAGHGGWDLGTVGKKGLLEKDLVLEIAQRLGKLLESRLGAEVILTRKDDVYIPLDERAGMANQAQADLFISVHANYSDLPSARGVETYYTNFFATPNAKDRESRDPGGDRNVGAALSPADLHEKIEQSRRLAASVQRSLYGTLSAQNPGLRDRGVKEASYVVLTETTMPGILAEVSFVSSPADEQKLRSDGYREQIAEALYKGVARYAVTSRSVKMASAAK